MTISNFSGSRELITFLIINLIIYLLVGLTSEVLQLGNATPRGTCKFHKGEVKEGNVSCWAVNCC